MTAVYWKSEGAIGSKLRYSSRVDFDRVMAILRAFERRGVAYKVVGGVAMNVQGLARATRDLDVFVEPTAENLTRLRAALHSGFDDPSIAEITAEDLCGDYPAIQYVPPVEGFHIDILARLGEAFDFASIETEARTFEGVSVPVATRAMLYEMKRATVRLRDRLDSEWPRSRMEEGG